MSSPVAALLTPVVWGSYVGYGVLQITDGTDTIDLLDTNGLYVARGGYAPKVAYQDEIGEWGDLSETISLWNNLKSEDDRAPDFQKMMRLARKARRYSRENRLDDMVWIAASRHTETNTRYAIIKNLGINQLSPRHWSARNKVPMTISIIREGAWRGVAPNATPTEVLASTTIEYYTDGASNVAYVDVPAANVPGDADALTQIEISPSGPTGYVVPQYYLSARSSVNNALNPWFNANDELDNTADQATDAYAPDNTKLSISGSSDVTLRWTIPAADMPHYYGSFAAYAVCKASSDDVITIRYRDEGQSGGYVAVDDYTSIYFGIHYLGQFALPHGGKMPTAYQTAADYTIRLDVDKASTTIDFDFYSLVLLPVEQIQYIQALGARSLLDGDLEIAIDLNTSDELLSGSPAPARGSFISLPPNETTRIWLLGGFTQGSPAAHVAPYGDETMDIVVRAIPRYSALRGKL